MRKLLSLIFCITAALALSKPAISQSVDAQKEKKARLEKEIAIIDKQLAKVSS